MLLALTAGVVGRSLQRTDFGLTGDSTSGAAVPCPAGTKASSPLSLEPRAALFGPSCACVEPQTPTADGVWVKQAALPKPKRVGIMRSVLMVRRWRRTYTGVLEHDIVVPVGPGGEPGARLRAPISSIHPARFCVDGSREDFRILVGPGGSSFASVVPPTSCLCTAFTPSSRVALPLLVRSGSERHPRGDACLHMETSGEGLAAAFHPSSIG